MSETHHPKKPIGPFTEGAIARSIRTGVLSGAIPSNEVSATHKTLNIRIAPTEEIKTAPAPQTPKTSKT